MKQVIEKLAARIKELRKERGMIQPVLARKAGLSEGYLARLETQRHDPRLTTLLKLARALRVPVAELLK
jgi:transcriptional regulator with XRE-family HTH domain